MDNIETKATLFGNFFLVANKLQTFGDKYFFSDDEITVKQWFMMAIIEKYFQEPPKLIDIANKSGTSYQNVKVIISKLEKNGFAKIQQDINDKRVLRVTLTDKCREYWQLKENDSLIFLNEIFSKFSDDELSLYLKLTSKLIWELDNLK